MTLQRIDDGVVSFAHDARAAGVHTDALTAAIARRRAELPARLVQTASTALQASLRRPGEAWQRALHQGLGRLSTVLPLLVLGWAGYKLFKGFSEGSVGSDGSAVASYLGVNFAVHTAMLAGLAWAVPFVLHKKTCPSRVKAAQRGLAQGLEQALNDTEQHIQGGIAHAALSREELIADLRQIQSIGAKTGESPPLSESMSRLVVS